MKSHIGNEENCVVSWLFEVLENILNALSLHLVQTVKTGLEYALKQEL